MILDEAKQLMCRFNCILILLTASSKENSATDPHDSENIRYFDTVMSNFMRERGIPGASVAISKNGEFLFRKGNIIIWVKCNYVATNQDGHTIIIVILLLLVLHVMQLLCKSDGIKFSRGQVLFRCSFSTQARLQYTVCIGESCGRMEECLGQM